LQLKQIK